MTSLIIYGSTKKLSGSYKMIRETPHPYFIRTEVYVGDVVEALDWATDPIRRKYGEQVVNTVPLEEFINTTNTQ